MGWLAKAPARFILILLVIWVLAALLLVVDIAATRSLDGLAGFDPVAESARYALFAALFPAVLLTLVLRLMSLRRSSDHPLMLRGVYLLLSGAIVVAGFHLLGDPYRASVDRLGTAGYELTGDTIYRFDEASLYLTEVETYRLLNPVVVPRAITERMQLLSEGRYLPGPDREIVQIPGVEGPFLLREAHGGPWRGPSSSRVFERLLGDFRFLNRELLEFPATSGAFLIRIAAILLFVAAAWVLLRLTRWPLFNVFLFLLAVRGMLRLPPALQTETARELLESYLGLELLPLVPFVFFLGCAGLFVLINLLLPGLAHWERETLDG